MMKRLGLCSLVAFALLTPAEAQKSSQSGDRTKEQVLFGAEDAAVDRPVEVPKGALEILKKDDTVLQYLKAEKESPEELTTKPFLASEVHLDGPEETDLIVIGIGWLRGNAATFWIFRKLAQNYKLVLKVASHDLRIETTRWKGLRNITTASPVAGSAVEVHYRFDGQQYKFYRKKSELIH